MLATPMKTTLAVAAGLAMIVLALPCHAQSDPPAAPPRPSPWFYGGGIGMAFGDVDLIEVYPLIGYRANPRLSLGGGVSFRYLKDDRYAGAPSTTDYGSNLFARFHVTPQWFLEADVEFLSHEFVWSDLSTDRENFTTALGGVGFSNPLGGRASVFVLALYDFTHDANDPFYPYADPWIVRAGVSVGF
jgi:hypothetical protein